MHTVTQKGWWITCLVCPRSWQCRSCTKRGQFGATKPELVRVLHVGCVCVFEPPSLSPVCPNEEFVMPMYAFWQAILGSHTPPLLWVPQETMGWSLPILYLTERALMGQDLLGRFANLIQSGKFQLHLDSKTFSADTILYFLNGDRFVTSPTTQLGCLEGFYRVSTTSQDPLGCGRYMLPSWLRYGTSGNCRKGHCTLGESSMHWSICIFLSSFQGNHSLTISHKAHKEGEASVWHCSFC